MSDVYTRIILTVLAVFAGLLVVQGSGLMSKAGIPHQDDRQAAFRYRLMGARGIVFKIDTHTGETWQMRPRDPGWVQIGAAEPPAAEAPAVPPADEEQEETVEP